MIKRESEMGIHTRSVMTILLMLPALAMQSPAAGAMESADCLGCHGDSSAVGAEYVVGAAFDSTAHAELGCAACHPSVGSSHPDDGQPPEKAACQNCHDGVQAEYAASMHGKNAACNDCHNPHNARGSEEVSGYDMNRPCVVCHDGSEMAGSHAGWLPQADLHLGALPCITCHTGSQEYVITFYLRKKRVGDAVGSFLPAGYEELSILAGEGGVQRLIDGNGDDLISLEELYVFNRQKNSGELTLQGMMTPATLTHTYQILESRWDCSFCHASGPQASQTSYVAFPEEDGSFRRVAVEKGAVLDALYGTPDFYMLGATRSRAMNIAGLVILAGGLVLPVGHGSLRFLTRNNRKGKGHQS
jgi:predicted CXXCH cytochrome family protein